MAHVFFIKMGQHRPLFIYFGLFKQTSIQFLQQINVAHVLNDSSFMLYRAKFIGRLQPYLKNWAIPGLFIYLFWSFQQLTVNMFVMKSS